MRSRWSNRSNLVFDLALATPVVGQVIFGLWVGLVLFYRTGAYFLDAGFYVYAVASSEAPSTPALVQSAWGDSVFLTHTTLSPMGVMGLLRVILPIPLNFIAYLALQHGLLALVGLLLMRAAAVSGGASKRQQVALGMMGVVLLPLSNIGLGSLAYPHVEIFGSAAIALGVILLTRAWTTTAHWSRSVTAFVVMLVGVLVREDLGGHIAIAATAALVCASPRSLPKQAWLRFAVLAGFGAASTVLLLAWQRLALGSDGAFDISYSGTPAYAHITSVWYLVERAMFMIGSRLDLVAGMVVFTLVSVVYRRRELLAFPLACLPWMILNVTSVDPNKHSLGIYGMFPMVVYLSAPLISMAIKNCGESTDSLTTPDRTRTPGQPHVIAYLAVLATLFLGGISGPPNGGGYIFHSLLRNRPVSPAVISSVHDSIEDFAERGTGIAVDDAVMSLDPVRFEYTPLISGVTDATSVSAAMFYPRFVLGSASVQTLFDAWITSDRRITITCLHGGLALAEVGPRGPSDEAQTSLGQWQRAQRCHPIPSL